MCLSAFQWRGSRHGWRRRLRCAGGCSVARARRSATASVRRLGWLRLRTTHTTKTSGALSAARSQLRNQLRRPGSSVIRRKPGQPRRHKPTQPRKDYGQPSVQRRRGRTDQAGVCGVDRVAAHGAATCHVRTPAAYAGVTAYAHKHTGEAAAAAYLALGHAYLLDKRYAEAVRAFTRQAKAGEVLADYADFLAAQADTKRATKPRRSAAAWFHRALSGQHLRRRGAGARGECPAGSERCCGRAARAWPQRADPAAGRAGYQLARGQVAQALGQNAGGGEHLQAAAAQPSAEPGSGRLRAPKLTAMGAEAFADATELRSLGDAYYNAGRYEEAGEQYRALARKAGLDRERAQWLCGGRGGMRSEAEAADHGAGCRRLPDTEDENGARRLYLLMELARNRDDIDDQQQHCDADGDEFPQSQWLAEALFSSGNMYLLRKDYPHGGGVLQLPGRAFSGEQECGGGALARGLAELPAGSLRRCGAHLRRADHSFIPARRRRWRALLARAPL